MCPHGSLSAWRTRLTQSRPFVPELPLCAKIPHLVEVDVMNQNIAPIYRPRFGAVARWVVEAAHVTCAQLEVSHLPIDCGEARETRLTDEPRLRSIL